MIPRKNCKQGPFVDARHNTIRDTLHGKAKLVYSDTKMEPKLQKIGEENLPRGGNTQDGARADIRIKNYTRPLQNSFFGDQIINIQSQCNENITPIQAMKKAEEKKETRSPPPNCSMIYIP